MQYKVEVVEFEPEHIYKLRLRDEEEDVRNLKIYENITGPAVTILINNKPIACGGVHIFDTNRGVGEAWVVCDRNINKYIKPFFEISAGFLNEVIKTYGLRRLQARVVVDFELGVQYVEHLGFKREGTMKKFGPDGDDFYMYGRTD